MKKNTVYHILLWVFIFGMILDSMLFDYDWQEAVAFSLLECGINAFIAYANLLFFIPRFFEKKGSWAYVCSIIVFYILIALPYNFTELGYYLLDTVPLRVMISYAINFVFIILISFLFWKVSQYEMEKKRRLAINNQKLKTELLLLKSQVSPHFLFNTLNNIYSLSLEGHQHAPIMIEKLSEILRYLIYEGKKESVPLEKEAHLIEEYIALQRLKQLKGENHLKLTIEGVEQRHKIAPLLLVNLVENGFKHGDINYNTDGFLRILLNVKDDLLKFKIENSYQENKKDKGIGISNIREQLKLSYPNAHQLDIHKDLNTYEVSLSIKFS